MRQVLKGLVQADAAILVINANAQHTQDFVKDVVYDDSENRIKQYLLAT